jgi:energy-coupling factor transport system permease protein
VRRDRRPHALAWWLWGLGLATAALRTSNPILLLGLGTVAAVVGLLCRSEAPWGRSVGVFVRIGLVVIALRLVLQIVFGQRLPGHVLFTLPSVPLPSWAAGVSIGGPVTLESILMALVGGLRLAVVLVAFGAVNAVASPRELLRSLPAMLHEVAVAITVGLCFVPEVMSSLARVREARRLRGRPTRGFAGLRGTAVPVLEDALERSGQLAASMGARGFGRAGSPRSAAVRRLGRAALLAGVLLVVLGSYGILGGSAAVPAAAAPLCVAGAVLLWAGVAAGHQRSARTRYRPAPFGLRSVACSLSGWLPVATFALVAVSGSGAISWSPYPLSWPSVPIAALIGIMASALPALLVVAPLQGTRAAPRRTEELVGS